MATAALERGATLTALGAGAILARPGYGAAGYALRPAPDAKLTLLDCGPGSLRALANAGLALADVERVLVSHFHPDHVLDLFALAFARRNPAFAPGPLELVGPRGLAELLERGASALGRWCRFEETRVVEVEPERAPRSMEHALGRLAWVHNEHTPESLSWRVDLAGGASLCFSGDSGERPQVAALARGVDVFLCECSFPDEEAAPHHLTPSSAARLAQAAGCARLILTHFYPSMEPERAVRDARALFDGPVEAARDGSRHALDAPRPSSSSRP